MGITALVHHRRLALVRWIMSTLLLATEGAAWFSTSPTLPKRRKFGADAHITFAAPQIRPTAYLGKSSYGGLIRQTEYLKNPRPNEKVEKAPVPQKENEDGTLFDMERSLTLLVEALISFNSTAAKDLITQITNLRQTKNGQQAAVKLLDGLLKKGPDSKLPVWSKIRLLGRFSKRARWASLRRTLDLATPPPNAEDDIEDNLESQTIRRRRTLGTLIRALAAENPTTNASSEPAIRVLEKKAAQEQENQLNNEDLTSRRPEGLETPNYVVLEKRSNTFEIRRYDEFSVCSVSMSKPRPEDLSKTDASISEPTMRGASAFGALAGYLFGKNQQEQPMKMTTPVLTNARSTGEERLMSFVLPSEFWKDATIAPQPLEGSGVTLEKFQGGERAVIMFGGYASKKTTDQQSNELLRQLERDEKWQAVEGGSVSLAQYNDPFTPPWKRLNEVSISVKPRK